MPFLKKRKPKEEPVEVEPEETQVEEVSLRDKFRVAQQKPRPKQTQQQPPEEQTAPYAIQDFVVNVPQIDNVAPSVEICNLLYAVLHELKELRRDIREER